jgi:hypothetical protein
MFPVYSHRKFFLRKNSQRTSAFEGFQPGVQAGNFASGGIFVDNALADAPHDCRLRLFQRSRSDSRISSGQRFFNLAHCAPNLAFAVLIDSRAAGGLTDALFSGSVTGHG